MSLIKPQPVQTVDKNLVLPLSAALRLLLLLSLTAMTPDFNHTWQNRDQDNAHNQQLQVFLHHRQIAKQVAGIGEQQHPEQRTRYVEQREVAIGHMAHTGNKRRKGSHDRHEARQDNGFSAMTGIKRMGFIQIAATENLLVRITEQPFAKQAANGVVQCIAQNRGHH
jgi:hypothetical protein